MIYDFLQFAEHGVKLEHAYLLAPAPLLMVTALTITWLGLKHYGQLSLPGGLTVSEAKYYTEVSLCFCGICSLFVVYGICQEQIMTHEYANGGHFPSSIALVLANRTLALFLIPPLVVARGERMWWTGWWWCAIPAVTLVISSWCQHESLRYVSFPTQIVFKSSKLIPTMAIGWLMLARRYPWQDYAMAAVLSVAVCGFSLSMENPSTSEAAQKTMFFGIAMMTLFLVCDAATSNSEKKVYEKFRDTSPFQMFLAMAFFSWMYSLVCVEATEGVFPVLNFLGANPSCVWHVAILSVSACLGQIVIFYVVKAYGPVVLCVMMTVRQMLSMLTSALIFGHEIGPFTWLCGAVVFGIVFLQTYLVHLRKTTGKQNCQDGGESKEKKPLREASAAEYGADKEQKIP